VSRKKKLRDLIIQNKKSTFQVKSASSIGSYPFFTSGMKILRTDNVLTSGRNLYVATGGKAFIQYYEGDASYSTDCYSFKTDEKIIEPKFLYYFLYMLMNEVNEKMFKGAALKHLQKTDFLNIEVPVMELGIQKQIVKKIDSVFLEIDKAVVASESNSKNAEALFHSYLTDVFERGGEDWITTVLDKVCKVDRGSSPRPIKNYFTDSEDGVNWIKIGDTEEGGKYIFSTNQKITKAGAEKSRYVDVGDFILTNSMSYGRPYIMRTSGYIHDGWFVLRLNEDIDAEYFYYLLTSPYVQNQFKSLAAGSVVKNISGDLVKKTVLPIPKFEEQRKLAENFSEKQVILNRLSEVYLKKANEMTLLKSSVLQQAFNGELITE
jgi:type I restriction enzyme S subunit